MEVVLENCGILIHEKKISSMKYLPEEKKEAPAIPGGGGMGGRY
jgi:hypothetical protein